MIKPGEIQQKANQSKVRDRQIEKDYIITWILFGISKNKFIFNNLLFRGERKARNKKYNPEEFIGRVLSKEQIFKRDWNNNLGNQIRELPDFSEVMRELKKQFRKF